MIEQADIKDLLDKLDGSGSDSEFDAIYSLRELGDELPQLLLNQYTSARKWQARSSCVYHAIRYARSSSKAIELAIKALADKSHAVRYRACMLLAYSLDRKVLPILHEALDNASHEETTLDISAAIDAIEHENSNYFVDRDHSGNMTLNIN